MVALFAAILSVSAWLPWLTTGINGGGWANAIGGSIGSLHLPHGFGPGQLIVLLSSALLVAGAMVGRGLSVKPAYWPLSIPVISGVHPNLLSRSM